mgnify:CR=1 FL=1
MLFCCNGGDYLKEQQVSSELIRGHIDAMILQVLSLKDSYGYEILKSIQVLSNGEYELKEPTLYTSLKRLEKSQMIESYWGEESHGGRRKYYHITPNGIEEYKHSLEEWKKARRVIDLLLGDIEE